MQRFSKLGYVEFQKMPSEKNISSLTGHSYHNIQVYNWCNLQLLTEYTNDRLEFSSHTYIVDKAVVGVIIKGLMLLKKQILYYKMKKDNSR